jgi:ribosome production factor 1
MSAKRKRDDESSAGAAKKARPAQISASSSTSAPVSKSFLKIQPSQIKNKMKRSEVYQKQKKEKKKLKTKERQQRQKEAEALGDEAPPKQPARTLDNTREKDETIVTAEDEEVKADEAIDEFSDYFSGKMHPKIIITTCLHPTKVMYDFVRDLLKVFPDSQYYARRSFELRQIVKFASERGFTDVVVINEDRKSFNGWTHFHLPNGPTAHFKLSSVVLSRDIPGHGKAQLTRPEVILNNFNTRLGHRIGRMLGALFHQQPQFKGRRVATFHNQRDFVFFRHHRYVVDQGEKARLQELGPRFTLKLK